MSRYSSAILVAILISIALFNEDLFLGLAFCLGYFFGCLLYIFTRRSQKPDVGVGWEKGTIDKWTSRRRRGK